MIEGEQAWEQGTSVWLSQVPSTRRPGSVRAKEGLARFSTEAVAEELAVG